MLETLKVYIEFICNSRKLLYNLSEDITDDDLKQMKFLLNKKLPRSKLGENVVSMSSKFNCW